MAVVKIEFISEHVSPPMHFLLGEKCILGSNPYKGLLRGGSCYKQNFVKAVLIGHLRYDPTGRYIPNAINTLRVVSEML